MSKGGRNAQAMKLQQDAAKKKSKFDWFGANKERNNEEAAELYVKAAAQWKIAKEFMAAGDCYMSAADCNKVADNQIEANQNFREAGKAYRHVDPERAIEAYKHAIEHYLSSDRFNQAARLHEEIADMLAEDDNLEEACTQYEEAADLLETDNDESGAIKRRLKVAHMQAKNRSYARAIEIFEKAANHYVDNQLLRWNVRVVLFKAFICVLNDACIRDDPKLWSRMPSVVERYMNISDLFASSRECKLCVALAEAVPNHDVGKFTEEIEKYRAINKPEPWIVEQLLRIKEYMGDKLHARPDLMDGPGDGDMGSGGPDLQSAATDQPDPFQKMAQADAADAPDLLG